MEVQYPVVILPNRTQGQAQNPIHQVEHLVFDLEGAVRRVRVEQVVIDFPGPGVHVVVDNEAEASDVSDVHKGVPAFGVDLAHVHHGRDEERLLGVLVARKAVAAQQLVGRQREGQQLRTADAMVADHARVEYPQTAALVDLCYRHRAKNKIKII